MPTVEQLLELIEKWRQNEGIEDEWARGRYECADDLESLIEKS